MLKLLQKRKAALAPGLFSLSTIVGLVSHSTATWERAAWISKCQDSLALPLGQQKHSPTAQTLQHPLTDLLGSVKQTIIMMQ